LDSQELRKPASPLHSKSSETASPTPNNHGTPITRTFHTSVMNRNYFHFQQQRRLKGSLAADGSTLMTETSKSTVSDSDPTAKDDANDLQMNSASVSSSSSKNNDISQPRKDGKKVDNFSGVSNQNLLLRN